MVNVLNDYAFNGNGGVTTLDKRSFNLYQEGQNQIINFLYSTGHLNITWKYKYFQKEFIHERQFTDVRNLSIFEQQRLSEILIKEMDTKIQNHKRLVLKHAPQPQIPIHQLRIVAVRQDMESKLRDLLMKTLKDAQQLPELMHGVVVMQAAGNFSKNLKDNYPEVRQEMEELNEEFLDETEFNEMVDEVTTSVLGEFIEFPLK